MEAEKFARTTLLKAGKKLEKQKLRLLGCSEHIQNGSNFSTSLSEGRHTPQGLSSLTRGHADM